MLTVKEREKEINKLKANVDDHIENIEKLKKDIENDKNKYLEENETYKELIAKGEVEKADEMYITLDRTNSFIKAKENRLSIMEETKKKVIKENGEKIGQLSSEYYQSFKEENNNLLELYKAKQKELKDIKNKIIDVNNSCLMKNDIDSRYLNQLIVNHNINRTYFNGNVNRMEPFDITQ